MGRKEGRREEVTEVKWFSLGLCKTITRRGWGSMDRVIPPALNKRGRILSSTLATHSLLLLLYAALLESMRKKP